MGAIPKTLWVMDYPMLERTYYELVVNYNVFGTAAHQAETRLYFDLIRSGGENNFLHFMPPGVRTAMRNSWYQGSAAQKKLADRLCRCQRGPAGADTVPDPGPQSRVCRAGQRAPQVAGRAPDVLNRCAQPPCYRADASAAERQVETSLQTLASKPASPMACISSTSCRMSAFCASAPGTRTQDLAYTLVRNKAHTNVAFLLG